MKLVFVFTNKMTYYLEELYAIILPIFNQHLHTYTAIFIVFIDNNYHLAKVAQFKSWVKSNGLSSIFLQTRRLRFIQTLFHISNTYEMHNLDHLSWASIICFMLRWIIFHEKLFFLHSIKNLKTIYDYRAQYFPYDVSLNLIVRILPYIPLWNNNSKG